MNRNITMLKAKVGNYSIQSSFEFKILNLPGVPGGNLVEFFATGVDTPESDTEDVIPVWWRGVKGEMPANGKLYGDMSVMCNLDADGVLYDQLYRARNMVFDQNNNLINDWGNYTFSATVRLLSPHLNDAAVGSFTLVDCYVKKLGSIKKSHSSNEKDECELVIHYDSWRYTKI